MIQTLNIGKDTSYLFSDIYLEDCEFIFFSFEKISIITPENGKRLNLD